jgi:SAM-dependent methyltransferase
MSVESLFYQVFEGLERQGPGNAAATRCAWNLVPALAQPPSIVDIGCGAGGPAVDLACLSGGQVTAVDNHAPFCGRVAERAREAGVAQRVRAVVADMAALPFGDAEFDVVWSEGAIYSIGFEAGLTAWRRLLRPRGCLAASEVVWIRDDPPPELAAFWEAEYPAIATDAENAVIVAAAGYTLLGRFHLPRECWWEGYYVPLQRALDALRIRLPRDGDAARLCESLGREIDIYRRYGEWYTYSFYIMQVA